MNYSCFRVLGTNYVKRRFLTIYELRNAYDSIDPHLHAFMKNISSSNSKFKNNTILTNSTNMVIFPNKEQTKTILIKKDNLVIKKYLSDSRK